MERKPNKSTIVTIFVVAALFCIIFLVSIKPDKKSKEVITGEEVNGFYNRYCDYYNGDLYYFVEETKVVKTKASEEHISILPVEEGQYEEVFNVNDYLESRESPDSNHTNRDSLYIYRILIQDDILYCSVNDLDNRGYTGLLAFDLNENKIINKINEFTALEEDIFYHPSDISFDDGHLYVAGKDGIYCYNKDLSSKKQVLDRKKYSDYYDGTGFVYQGCYYEQSGDSVTGDSVTGDSVYGNSVNMINLSSGHIDVLDLLELDNIVLDDDDYCTDREVVSFLVYNEYLYYFVSYYVDSDNWGVADGEGIYRCNLNTKEIEFIFEISDEEAAKISQYETWLSMTLKNACDNKLYISVYDGLEHEEDGWKTCDGATLYEVDLKTLEGKNLGFYNLGISSVYIVNGDIVIERSLPDWESNL